MKAGSGVQNASLTFMGERSAKCISALPWANWEIDLTSLASPHLFPYMYYLLSNRFFPALSCLSLYLFTFTHCKPNTENSSFNPVEDQAYQVESQGNVDPIAVSIAKKGGVFTTWGGPYPKSLNYWLDSWHISGEIMGLLYQPLISMHSTANRPVGALAKTWNQAADKKTFTFSIHPKARWSDGKKVSAQDVQFYYDTIMNPKHRTTPSRVILSRFERPEIVNTNTVRIKAKTKHWKAFWDAGFFFAFPKHAWEGKDFNRINFQFRVVNGPYHLAKLKRNRFALLKRRKDWWGRVLKYNQGKYNFDYIRYRFMEDRTTALEAFKKGDFDVYPIYTSSLWVQQTNFSSVQKNWVIRQEVYNKEPKSFQGFAVNLRRSKFQDIRIRKALCHLFNRKLMNEKLMFNQYFLLNSYFPDLYPNNTNPNVSLCDYNPQKAHKLLDQAGWEIGKNGLRHHKDKKETFGVVFLTSMADLRHTNIYVEDLKKAGIDARIEQLSHATVTERIDNFKYDLFWTNTSGSRLRDPEASFGSQYADQIATANITGLKDQQVDSLLAKLKFEANIERRNLLLRKLDLRLSTLAPYILMWQADKSRLLYWHRFGTPKTILDKYSRENSIIVYWWVDPQKDKVLQEARKTGKPLKSQPAKVYYQER